jgi:hypothetical protein
MICHHPDGREAISVDPPHVSGPTQARDIVGLNRSRFLYQSEESYNAFAKWLSFGGEGVIAENDPDEQQKRLRYNDLVASAVIFHNVVDMTRIVQLRGVLMRFA